MHIEESGALAELQGRFTAMYEALSCGADVPPAQRLRTEGMMETLVLLEITTQAALHELMEKHFRQAYGVSLQQEWGDEWRELFPFPQIPGFGQRAPVVPSTRD